MNERDSLNREWKKDQLRSRMITTEQGNKNRQRSSKDMQEEDSERVVKKAHKKVRRRRFYLILTVIVLLAAAAGGAYWFRRFYQYEQAVPGWERVFDRGNGSFTGYARFGTNLLKYTKDGASYIDSSGKDVWIQSYEMKSPIAAVNGKYAAIADKQGNSIYICDETGPQGVATTVLPIVKVTVSAQGVVAAHVEDQNASYIYFYRKDGTEIKLSIKALLGGQIGYPLDIDLSPDGQMLMGSYVYLDGGRKNKVAFYNFSEVGKNAQNRFVGAFWEVYENSMVPRIHYMDDIHSVAFADNGLTFYSSKDVMSPELVAQVPVEETIRSIFYNETYAGIITLSSGGEEQYRLSLYRADGTQVFSREFSYEYSHVDIDGDTIFLYNEDSCQIYNTYGNLKFEGTFDFSVSKVTKGRLPNQIIVTGSQLMREYTLH